VVDRQLRTEQCIPDIANKLAIFDNFSVPAQTSLEPITEAVNRVDAELRASTRCLQEQITQLSTICSNLAQSRTPLSSPTSSPASRPQRAVAAGPATQIDRSRNVVITGIAEDRDGNVWKSKVMNILGITVGREVGISDAFRIGRYTAGSGRKRPILVRLNSAWDQRLVVGGARKLANAEGYDGVYVSADEPAEVRRNRVIERLKSRAVRAGQEAIVSLDGVLSLNGTEVYSVSRGRICDFSITNGSD
jgi:hypothetical protein